jgi:hypothetical protein
MESYRNPVIPRIPVGMVDDRLTSISLGIFLLHSLSIPIPVIDCDMKQGIGQEYSSGIQQDIPGMTA